ncbi:hypothetical protein [Burkholderia gladioli]|uniref:hypothetical protein n=1 Tax=Burkholderia gladioli TaxID=28095 RepID=UPI00163EE62E|nr:hypothetical protein [Burkholderia gladioli]
MFTDAKRELSELFRLVVELKRADATLTAKPEIVPNDEWRAERTRKEARRGTAQQVRVRSLEPLRKTPAQLAPRERS